MYQDKTMSRESVAPDRIQDRIQVVAVTHTGGQYHTQSSSRRTAAPGGARFDLECGQIARKLSALDRPYFQFSPVGPSCWTCVCATTNNPFADDHRRGTLPFAFLFSRAQAEVLLEEPNRLFRLRRWMEALPQEGVLELLGGFDCWPAVVLSAPAEGPALGDAGTEMLQVMMQDLYEQTSCAFCEDEGELSALLRTLPLKFRLSCSFATAYVRDFSEWMILFYCGGVPKKLTEGPTRKRYDIGKGLPNPRVSPQAGGLAELLQDLRRRDVLDRMDAEARSQEELKKWLQYLTDMLGYLDKKEARKAQELLRRDAITISRLVRWLSPEDQAAWAQLTASRTRERRSRRDGAWAEEAPAPRQGEGWPGPRLPWRISGARPLAAALMAAAALAYLVAGAQATELADHLYLTIRFTGGDALQLALGGVIGLCAGYLLFHRGGNGR